MNTDNPSNASDALLAERIWIRRLARALVNDPHDADDLVQESWLSLHGKIPPGVSHLRGWIRRGVRNLLRQERRGAARRKGRERAVARGEGRPSTHELLARAELSERLARAVRELPEGCRDVVLLRFYEDLPPRAIAARLELPVRTVESRLRRGLARLREKLDREQPGGREAWLGAMTALVGSGKLSAPVFAATAALVVASGATLWVWAHASPVAGTDSSGNGGVDSLATPVRAGDAAWTEREEQSGSRQPVARAEDRLVLTFQRAGDGELLVGLEGRRRSFSPSEEGAFTTDSSGRAELPWGAGEDPLGVTLDLEATETTREHRVRLGTGGEHTIEVPRRGGTIEGVAVDEQDRPVGRAEVLLWRARSKGELDLENPHLRATSAANGAFRIDDVHDQRGRRTNVVLGAWAPGLASDPLFTGRPEKSGAERGPRLVLRPARVLRGRVLDAAGRPVAGVELVARPTKSFDKKRIDRADRKQKIAPELRPTELLTRSGAAGEFQLALPRRDHRLSSEHPEHPSWSGEVDPQQEELRIVLGPEVRLTGRVVDLEGVALEGIRVRIACRERRDAAVSDAEGRFGFVGLSPCAGALVDFAGEGRSLHVENVDLSAAPEQRLEVALAPGLPLAGVLRDAHGEPIPRARIEIRGERLWASTRYAESRGATWEEALGRAGAMTDSAGGFRFEGLYPGRYRLLARDPSDAGRLAFAFAEAGDEEIELRGGAGFEESTTITGIVTDAESGVAPPFFTVRAVRHHDAESGPSVQFVLERFQDGDGRFELRGLDPGYWQIDVSGFGFRAWQSELEPLGAGYSDFEVLLQR